MICLLIAVAGCMTETLWRTPTGRVVTQEQMHGGGLVVYEGEGGPGGAPLGSLNYQKIRRIDVQTGKTLVAQRAEASREYWVFDAFGVGGKFVLVDCGGASWAPSVRYGENPFDPDALELTFADAEADHALRLVRRFPKPILAPRSTSGPFNVWIVELENKTIQPMHILHRADQIECVNERILVEVSGKLRAYSLTGTLLWEQDTRGSDESLARVQCDSNGTTFVGLLGAGPWRSLRGGAATGFVLRDVASGKVLWEREIVGASYVLHAFEELGYVILVVETHDAFEFDEGTPYAQWTVWDLKGKKLASDQPVRDSRYDDALNPYVVGFAFDRDEKSAVIGTGVKAVYLRGEQEIRELRDLPGRPVFLQNGLLIWV